MQRVISVVEKCIIPDAPSVIVLTNASARVLQNLSGDRLAVPVIPAITDEIAARYVMNTGSNDAYYSLGITCDPTSNDYHGILKAGQQINFSDGGYSVDMYCASGTTVAVTILRRKDLTTHRNIMPLGA